MRRGVLAAALILLAGLGVFVAWPARAACASSTGGQTMTTSAAVPAPGQPSPDAPGQLRFDPARIAFDADYVRGSELDVTAELYSLRDGS